MLQGRIIGGIVMMSSQFSTRQLLTSRINFRFHFNSANVLRRSEYLNVPNFTINNDTLDFQNFKFLTVDGFQRVELRRCAKFSRNRTNRCPDMAIFRFFKMAAAPSWTFKCLKVWYSERSTWRNCVTLPNFVEIGQIAAKVWWFFDFQWWRPPPSCIFKISNFQRLTASRGLELRRHAKFGWNRSNRFWDMAIFYFSRWSFKFLKFWRSDPSRGSNCVAVPNFVEIGQTAAKIWRFVYL